MRYSLASELGCDLNETCRHCGSAAVLRDGIPLIRCWGSGPHGKWDWSGTSVVHLATCDACLQKALQRGWKEMQEDAAFAGHQVVLDQQPNTNPHGELDDD